MNCPVEVVIIRRYEACVGYFAVPYVNQVECGEIPITKEQANDDSFFEVLRTVLKNIVKES